MTDSNPKHQEAAPAPPASNIKHEFSVLDCNTNFDARALTGPFSWAARRDAVAAMIVGANADFVCLQELRDDAVRFLMAHPAIVARYDMHAARTNATEMALCLVTMWDKRRWTCAPRPLWFGGGNMFPFWADCGLGNGFGRVALVTEFRPAAVPDPKAKTVSYTAELPVREVPPAGPLVIYNVHLGLGEPERMLEADALHDHVREACRGAEIVVCGDFNSFPDAGGEKEVDVVCRGLPKLRPFDGRDPMMAPILRDVVDYGKPIRTASGITLTGTQISYPYDTYVKFKGTPREEVHPVEGEMGGRLDHVFHTSGLIPIDDMLLTHRMDGSSAVAADFGYHKADAAPRFPSDHLPWFVKFRSYDPWFGKECGSPAPPPTQLIPAAEKPEPRVATPIPAGVQGVRPPPPPPQQPHDPQGH